MANPDGAKPREEEANMAMALATGGLRTEQEYISDAEGPLVDEGAAKNDKKKSCFQITSVKASENPNDDNESVDDMDESRAEDFSSSELLDVSKVSTQTDLERLELEEHAHSTPKKVTLMNNVPPTTSIPLVVNNANQTVPNDGILKRRTGSEPPHELPSKTVAPPTNGNGHPSRFKVVKVPRIEPFTRGRWTCRDYETQPKQSLTSSDNVSISSRTEPPQSQQQQQNKDLHSGNSSAASSVHENQNADSNQLPGDSSASGTSEQTGNNSNTSKSHHHHRNKHFPHGTLEDHIKDTLYMDTHSGGPSTDGAYSEDGDGTSAGGAIDNKIEQAMDLVKSHLLFAVREEVEVLKVQIKELGEQNDALLRENQMLRQTNPQAVAQHNLPNPPTYANTTQTLPPPTQGQTISPPQGQQQQLHGMSMAQQHQQGLPPPQQQQQSQQGSQLPPQGSQHAMSIPQQQQQLSQQQQASQPPQQQQQQPPPQQQQLQMPLQQHSIPSTQQAGALPPQQQSQHAQQQAVPQQQSHPAKT